MISNRQEFLDAATSVGKKLICDAIWHGSKCNWLGFSSEPDASSPKEPRALFGTCGPDIYSGTSGIALFLSQLYLYTREKEFYKTAEGALYHALSGLDYVENQNIYGFYTGLSGVAYAALQIGLVLCKEEFINYSLKIIRKLANKKIDDHGIDVIDGNAGSIPTLISLYLFHRKEIFLDLAIHLADELLVCAKKEKIGWSWGNLKFKKRSLNRNLTGFAHGACGFAWGLLELYECTKQEKYANAAEEAFRYERYWFNQEEENWPDFHDSYLGKNHNLEGLTYPIQWCHGAPGIGLTRIRAYQILRNDVYLEETRAAIRTTMKMLDNPLKYGQDNFSLCHGLAGNSELLIISSQVLNDGSLQEIAEKIGERGIEEFQRKKLAWPCGIPYGETPCLMLGLAGIGYFYLRLYNPIKIPPILIIFPEMHKSIIVESSR
jgi:lantibiotic biosynthesis protein